MISVKEISSESKFRSMRNEWNDLLKNSDANSLFLTWEWVFNWWKCYGLNNELKILEVREDSQLIGIAPLYTSGNGNIGIQLLGSSYVGADYLDLILLKGNDNAITAIYDYLNSDKKSWEKFNLMDIPAGSNNIGYIRGCFRNDYYIMVNDYSKCPYIDLPASYDDFLQSVSSSMRYNIRRKRRRFENKLKGEFIVVRERDELNNAFSELLRLNKDRMRVKKIDSPFSNEKFVQFHRNLIEDIFDKDWVRLCFLKLKNKYIACLYIFKYGNKYYYYQSGFDPEWDKLSPGYLLFSYGIENAISEGMKEFDFLRGEEDYKFSWNNNIRSNVQLKLYKKNCKQLWPYLYDNIKKVGKSGIKKILNRSA